jgi:hypothetical protein
VQQGCREAESQAGREGGRHEAVKIIELGKQAEKDTQKQIHKQRKRGRH